MTRHIVTMELCRVVWLIDGAASDEAAIDRAWARYENGDDPDEIECLGATVRARKLPPTTLTELIRLPDDPTGDKP
jgi:hypothetical protein